MSIYRGIIFLLTDGGWVNSHQMSADFLSLPRSPLLGLPLLSWCAIAALLLVGYFLRYSRTGRALYTAGGNATAAYYTGINAGKMQFVSFCLSGALAGFCGYLWISRFAVAYVDVANGFGTPGGRRLRDRRYQHHGRKRTGAGLPVRRAVPRGHQ
ncbi:L-rhamnose ABC transporter, transmembrane component 2 [Klebsiella pneumoniae]|nr:L-rhamnose ABC transporter, transmembrane component 2 [Klebsiella pneumoniae]